MVDLAAEHAEEIGPPLNFIQYHQLVGLETEIASGVRETCSVAGVFEIEIKTVERLRCDGAGKCGLADLARPEESHGWRVLEILQNASLVSPLNHSC